MCRVGKVRAEGDGSKSMSVDKSHQLLKVGLAADFGFCKGTRKDGERCTMPVNVRECEWCEFHAAEALKRWGDGAAAGSRNGRLGRAAKRKQSW